MVLEHGKLTVSDKRALSEDVDKLTWKYTLKAGTVQVLPYEAAEREIGSLRVSIPNENQFAENVELNTRSKELEVLLARTKVDL